MRERGDDYAQGRPSEGRSVDLRRKASGVQKMEVDPNAGS